MPCIRPQLKIKAIVKIYYDYAKRLSKPPAFTNSQPIHLLIAGRYVEHHLFRCRVNHICDYRYNDAALIPPNPLHLVIHFFSADPIHRRLRPAASDSIIGPVIVFFIHIVYTFNKDRVQLNQ